MSAHRVRIPCVSLLIVLMFPMFSCDTGEPCSVRQESCGEFEIRMVRIWEPDCVCKYSLVLWVHCVSTVTSYDYELLCRTLWR